MPAIATNPSLLDVKALDALDARVERFARSGDPEHLWPGLREDVRVAAAQEIERVVRERLAGVAVSALDPTAELDGYAVAVAAHTTGMGPILGRWLERGELTTAPAHAASLREYLSHARARPPRMPAGRRPALDALADAGITPMAIKGLYTSSVLFGAPGLRRMSDVDLLVRTDQAPSAARALEGVGFTPFGKAGRRHKRDWIAPGVSPRVHSLELSDEFSRWTLELHTSLDSVFYRGAVARLDALATDRRAFVIEGRALSALTPEAALVLAACHCSELEANRLLRVYELVLLSRLAIDWDEVLRLLQRTGAARYTWPALVLTDSLAPHSIDPRVLALGGRASTWAARRLVPRLTPAGGRIGTVGVMQSLMWASGPVAIAERLARIAWPRGGWRRRLHQVRRALTT